MQQFYDYFPDDKGVGNMLVSLEQSVLPVPQGGTMGPPDKKLCLEHEMGKIQLCQQKLNKSTWQCVKRIKYHNNIP